MIRTPLYVMGRDPKLFDDPLEYRPERWLRDDTHKSPYHAFASLPFGFGTRMCLGKWMDGQVYTLIAAVIYHSGLS